MTIGTKIKLYRNRAELSQEELGEKLSVTVDTIKLWEEGQALPDAENLIRLKEIFGISIDSLLENDNITQEQKPVPYESYTFTYSEEELSEIYKVTSRGAFKKIFLVFFGLILILVGFILRNKSGAEIGFLAGAILTLAIIYATFWNSNKKMWKSVKQKVTEGTYEYQIYNDYIMLNIYKNQEVTNKMKLLSSNIQNVQDLGKFFVFQCSNQSHILKKSEMNQNSPFYKFFDSHSSKKIIKSSTAKKNYNSKPKSATDTDKKFNATNFKVLSWILFVVTIISIYGPLICIAWASEFNGINYDNMWVFFLFLPIPVASIILGIFLNSKGQKGTKNIAVGLIMAFVFCIFGSFTFLFSDTNAHNYESILKTEKYTGIDIPEHNQINTQNWDKYSPSKHTSGYLFSQSDIYFSQKNVEAFETRLTNDERWISELPSELVGILSPNYYYLAYDYVLKLQ